MSAENNLLGETITAELTGKPIRRLLRNRLLQTGQKLCNKFGQELWTIVAFCPHGARLHEWPTDRHSDLTWTAVYEMYEAVPSGEGSDETSSKDAELTALRAQLAEEAMVRERLVEALKDTNRFLSEDVYSEVSGHDGPAQPADELSYKAIPYMRANQTAIAAARQLPQQGKDGAK